MFLRNRGLSSLAQELRNGQITVAQVVELCCYAYESTEKSLNAYKTWAGDLAKEIAFASDILLKRGIDLGPLMGIPVSVKDLYAVTKLPTYAGTKRRLGGEWEISGTFIQRFEKQLSPIMGKTHTVEFAFGGIGINPYWETPKNVWGGGYYIPGGSSSGAGVSLLQQSALVALGTDTAGSVRIPASFSGTVGLKTSKGLWATDGVVPLSKTLDTLGILTNTVEDAVFVFCALENKNFASSKIEPFLLQGLRLGVPRKFFLDDMEDSIGQVFERFLHKISKKGVKVEIVDIPMVNDVFDIFKEGGLSAPELTSFLHTNFSDRLDELNPIIQLRTASSLDLTAIEYLERLAILNKASQRVKDVFSKVDAIIHPTVAISPPKLSDVVDISQYKKKNFDVLRNTSIANLMDLCAISIPIDQDTYGMPVGLQIATKSFDEKRLLSIALSIENLVGKSFDILGVPTIR